MTQGNCLDLLPRVASGSVDMVLCDLPYGTTACKWDSVIPFGPLWAQYKRVLKPGGVVALTASQPFTTEVVISNREWFRYEWIWKKNAGSNFAQVKYQPMKEHESVLIFYGQSGIYNPQMQARAESGAAMIRSGVKSKARSGDYAYGTAHQGYDNSTRDPLLRFPSSVQLFNRERGLHPTQKPVALWEYLIRTYTNEGDTVLDNCAGSGTTAVACQNTGRNFIQFELDPKYCEIARRRIEV